MTTTFGLLLPVLVAGSALGFTLWRSSARRLRRQPAVALGRVVMASRLVGSRQRFR
jgi:hypothetical protein